MRNRPRYLRCAALIISSHRYTANRQPGKALPYFLRLRRPNVFDLIRDNNLFTAVQDQALLLVEFDHELMEKRRKAGEEVDTTQSTAITLLVDHIHSVPVSSLIFAKHVNEVNPPNKTQIGRVVQQLEVRPYYLYLYLDALFAKDPHLTSDFADTQVGLFCVLGSTCSDAGIEGRTVREICNSSADRLSPGQQLLQLRESSSSISVARVTAYVCCTGLQRVQ